MTHPETTLDQLVRRSSELYSLPAVAMQVLELTNNPKVDATQLKTCIEHDPALTTKVLRVVNSSLFGLPRKVIDLNQALAMLGTQPLKLLVLGFSLPEGLFADIERELLRRYWKHTLTRAVAAREISEGLFNRPGDEAFIAGLLRDLGLLSLIQSLGQPYVDYLHEVYATGVDLHAAEKKCLGFDHTELTACMLDAWHLPPVLVEVVVYRPWQELGEQATSEGQALARIVYLADLMATLLAGGQVDLLPELLKLAWPSRNVDPKILENLVASLEEKVRLLAEVLSLELPGQLKYRDVLSDAHQRLVGVAQEAAEELIAARREAANAQFERLMLSDEARQLTEAAGRLHPSALQASTLPASAPAKARQAAAVEGKRAAMTSGESAVATLQPARHAVLDDWEADPGLLGHVTAAVAASRQKRRPLTLLLVEMDHYDDVVFAHGAKGAEHFSSGLEAICRAIDHPGATCLGVRDGCLALILPDCEWDWAVRLGQGLLRDIRQYSASEPGGEVTVSIGATIVELPLKNFPPRDLIERAERCLYAAHISGGNVLKSIEIF